MAKVLFHQDDILWGFVDLDGELLFRFEAFFVGDYGEFDLAPINVENDFGFIDRSGRFQIQPSFLYAGIFSEGLAPIQKPYDWTQVKIAQKVNLIPKGAKFTFIDRDANPVFEEEWDYANGFSEGLASVHRGRKWGYIDLKGHTAVPFEFDTACDFDGGLAFCQKGNIWGYIDRVGNWVRAVERS